MAQLVVRNIEQSVKTRLQRRAKRNGHSMAEEVRNILRDAVKQSNVEEGLGTKFSRRYARAGLRSGEDIPELRGFEVRPVIFKK